MDLVNISTNIPTITALINRPTYFLILTLNIFLCSITGKKNDRTKTEESEGYTYSHEIGFRTNIKYCELFNVEECESFGMNSDIT